MNKDILKGKWTQVKGTIQKKWGQITDDDLTKIKGDTTRFKGILQEKYGYTRQEAEKIYDEVFDIKKDIREDLKDIREDLIERKDNLLDRGHKFKDRVTLKKQEFLTKERRIRDFIPGNEYLTDQQIINKRNEEIATYKQKDRFEDRYFPRKDPVSNLDKDGLGVNRDKNRTFIGDNMERDKYLEEKSGPDGVDKDLDRQEDIFYSKEALERDLLSGKEVPYETEFDGLNRGGNPVDHNKNNLNDNYNETEEVLLEEDLYIETDSVNLDNSLNPDEFPVVDSPHEPNRFSERAEIDKDLYGNISRDSHIDRRDIQEDLYDPNLYRQEASKSEPVDNLDLSQRDIKESKLMSREELEETLLQDEKDIRSNEDFYREEAEATEFIKMDNQIK